MVRTAIGRAARRKTTPNPMNKSQPHGFTPSPVHRPTTNVCATHTACGSDPFSDPAFVVISSAVPSVPGPPADTNLGHDQDPSKHRDRPGVPARGQQDPNDG